MKKSELGDFINYCSTHFDFSERVNFTSGSLSMLHIINFRSNMEDKEYFHDIFEKDNLGQNVTIFIDDEEVNKYNINEIDNFDDEHVSVKVSYSLSSLSESVLLYDKETFNKLIDEKLIYLKIKDILKIQKNLIVIILSDNLSYKLELKTKWSSFINNVNYLDKSPLVLQNFIPEEFQEKLSREIFNDFIDLIAERKLNNEYLIRLGNTKSIYIPDSFKLIKSEIISIYSIVKYIFDDEFRYDDKVQILRNIMTDCLLEVNIDEVNWSKILQILKDNYSLFIDNKLEKYNRLRIDLISKVLELRQKVEKSINDKIDDLSKQLLVVTATIITSFIVKIGNINSQIIIIISGIVYIIIMLVFNIIKGVHFSSDSFKKNKEDIGSVITELLELEYSDSNKFNSDLKEINNSLDKLINVEKIYNTLLVIILLALLAILFIA